MWHAHNTHVCLQQAIRPRWSGWWMISLSASFPSSSVQCVTGWGLVELLKVTEPADCIHCLSTKLGDCKTYIFFRGYWNPLWFFLHIMLYLNLTYQTLSWSKIDSSNVASTCKDISSLLCISFVSLFISQSLIWSKTKRQYRKNTHFSLWYQQAKKNLVIQTVISYWNRANIPSAMYDKEKLCRADETLDRKAERELTENSLNTVKPRAFRHSRKD